METHKFDVGLVRDAWDGKFRRRCAIEGDEDRMGEGCLAERGEESASEKGREEHIPLDSGEVVVFRPFLESDDSTGLVSETATSM